MCIHNRLLALIFRIALLLGCGIGLYLNSGIPNGELALYMLIFYTIQSNFLCFIFFAVLIIKNVYELINKGVKGSTSFIFHIKGAVTLSITVTFIIYHFILVPRFIHSSANYSIFNWQNILVHYFVPIAVLLDWLIFDEKLNFRWFDPILWLVFPVFYLIFVLLRAKLGSAIAIVKSNYPYFFIDVDMIGWINVLKNVCFLIIGFLFIGYIIYIIDKFPFERIVLKRVQKTSLHLDDKCETI